MIEMWSRATRSSNGKLLSWAGFVLTGFFCIFFLTCTMAVDKAQCYDAAVESYYDTTACSQFVYENFVRDAWDWYAFGRGGARNASQYDGDPNFRFALTDGKSGARLYSNVDDPDAAFAGWYCLLTEGDNQLTGYVWTAGDSAVRPDSSDDTETLMECYFSPDIGRSSAGAELMRQKDFFDALYKARTALPAGAGLCAAGWLFFVLVLLLGAGRLQFQEKVVFCWYDRVPAEFSLLVSTGLTYLMISAGRSLLQFLWTELAYRHTLSLLYLVCAVLCLTAAACLVMAWIMSFARFAKNGHAIQNFFLLRQAVHAGAALKIISLTWKAGALAAALAGGNFIAYKLFQLSSHYYLWFSIMLWCIAVVAWGLVWLFCIRIAHDLKALQQAGQTIAAGAYDTSIPTEDMLPVFRDYADTLANIGTGMNEAVATKIKSERLKAELITNVSHDLKTPLTSIINYTDLLQREKLPEIAMEYVNVLSRQGEKLKKLTEDLIDASKASSGAMPCHKMKGSLSELCEQALGEYQEKLETAHLEAVLDLPENGLTAVFDGRLTWRVLDNLLSNACKYAMPGTRLYMVGEQTKQGTVLSVKNVSATPLNTSADELMERFVRGDSSRTTEGSGLGLSIARSLTELQGAAFTLTVDGDLFKAEICFPPEAEPAGEETAAEKSIQMPE